LCAFINTPLALLEPETAVTVHLTRELRLAAEMRCIAERSLTRRRDGHDDPYGPAKEALNDTRLTTGLSARGNPGISV